MTMQILIFPSVDGWLDGLGQHRPTQESSNGSSNFANKSSTISIGRDFPNLQNTGYVGSESEGYDSGFKYAGIHMAFQLVTTDTEEAAHESFVHKLRAPGSNFQTYCGDLGAEPFMGKFRCYTSESKCWHASLEPSIADGFITDILYPSPSGPYPQEVFSIEYCAFQRTDQLFNGAYVSEGRNQTITDMTTDLSARSYRQDKRSLRLEVR